MVQNQNELLNQIKKHFSLTYQLNNLIKVIDLKAADVNDFQSF